MAGVVSIHPGFLHRRNMDSELTQANENPYRSPVQVNDQHTLPEGSTTRADSTHRYLPLPTTHLRFSLLAGLVSLLAFAATPFLCAAALPVGEGVPTGVMVYFGLEYFVVLPLCLGWIFLELIISRLRYGEAALRKWTGVMTVAGFGLALLLLLALFAHDSSGASLACLWVAVVWIPILSGGLAYDCARLLRCHIQPGEDWD